MYSLTAYYNVSSNIVCCNFVFQCAGFMMALKGLPSTYNKDLQVCM